MFRWYVHSQEPLALSSVIQLHLRYTIRYLRERCSRPVFIYPRSRYYGQIKPENLVFNANLQEFAQRISYICNLETGGKLSAEESYQQIKLSGSS